MSTPDEFEEWSERAAIMEHDGGLSKRHAEVLALGYLFEQAQQRQRAPGRAAAAAVRSGAITQQVDDVLVI
jgi:hypothetical protein